MQIIEIIEVGLKASGFTGLVVPGTCGCVIGDLSPGECLCHDCEGGYKQTHSQRPEDWIVSTNNKQKTDDEIDRIISECC